MTKVAIIKTHKRVNAFKRSGYIYEKRNILK